MLPRSLTRHSARLLLDSCSQAPQALCAGSLSRAALGDPHRPCPRSGEKPWLSLWSGGPAAPQGQPCPTREACASRGDGHQLSPYRGIRAQEHCTMGTVSEPGGAA